jgi:hypothetical protein
MTTIPILQIGINEQLPEDNFRQQTEIGPAKRAHITLLSVLSAIIVLVVSVKRVSASSNASRSGYPESLPQSRLSGSSVHLSGLPVILPFAQNTIRSEQVDERIALRLPTRK